MPADPNSLRERCLDYREDSGFGAFLRGLVLDSVTRGRKQAKHLAFLMTPAPGR